MPYSTIRVTDFKASCRFQIPWSIILNSTAKRTWDNEEVWFTNIPLGVNSINTFIPRKVVAAGLDSTKKYFTNHSIQKTTVKNLKKAGVNPSETIAITGHKNQQGLTDYDELDTDDHQRIGKCLTMTKMHNYQLQVIVHLIAQDMVHLPYLTFKTAKLS